MFRVVTRASAGVNSGVWWVVVCSAGGVVVVFENFLLLGRFISHRVPVFRSLFFVDFDVNPSRAFDDRSITYERIV